MDMEGIRGKNHLLKWLILLLACLSPGVYCETGDCREQEFMDHSGKCIPCKQCGPGEELSKECGLGYEEGAECMPCRPYRFKEDWGFQKCKPCQDCALVNRFQKANCSSTSNAVCGECLLGFYRKTKLGVFQDMGCVPCGDPPPPYEPHCHTKVNLVKIPSTASSPRDMALAAVICSALTTVLLALLILCIIYCKRQFMEKKPTWSTRPQDMQYKGSELSCFDRPRMNPCIQRTCHQCQRDPAQACGPVHLIPSLFCDETCSLEHSQTCCSFHSKSTLHDRNADSLGDMIPEFLGSMPHFTRGEFAEVWPLMQTTPDSESPPEDTEDCVSQSSLKTEDAVAMNFDTDQEDSAVMSSAEKAREPVEVTEGHKCLDMLPQTIQAVENQSTQGQGVDVEMREPSDAKKS